VLCDHFGCEVKRGMEDLETNALSSLALNATEPASECVWRGCCYTISPSLAGSVTIYAKTTAHFSPGSSMRRGEGTYFLAHSDSYLQTASSIGRDG
jgi:hypothetical protein